MPTRVSIYTADQALSIISALSGFTNNAIDTASQDSEFIKQRCLAIINGEAGLLTGAEYRTADEPADGNLFSLIEFDDVDSTTFDQLIGLARFMLGRERTDETDSQLLILRLCITHALHHHHLITEEELHSIHAQLHNEYPVANTAEIVAGTTIALPALLGWTVCKAADMTASALSYIAFPLLFTGLRYVTTKPATYLTGKLSEWSGDAATGSFWSGYGYQNFDELWYLTMETSAHLLLMDTPEPRLALTDTPPNQDPFLTIEDNNVDDAPSEYPAATPS